MGEVHVELGSDVVTADGLVFGKIQQLVVDPKTRSLPAIIVRYGRLPAERDFIVGWHLIDRVEGTEVHLTVEGGDVEKLPELMRVANVSGGPPTGTDYMSYWGGAGSYAIGESMRGGMSVVDQSGAVPVGMRTASDLVSTNVELQTNLPENTSMVSDDTDVMTEDEKKIGKVHEVVCDESGVITGFFGRAGRIRHHTFYVPLNLVAGGSHRYIRLNISSDEAAKTLSRSANG